MEQREQTLNIIWIAMTAAVGVYWYVHHLVGVRGTTPTTGLMTLLLAGISAAECAGGWIFNQRILTTIADKVSAFQLAGPSAEVRAELEQRLQSTAIICLALFEAIAVYGLVGSFIGSPYPYTFEWFAGVSLMNLVFYRLQVYPRIFQILERLEQARLRAS